MDLCTNPTKCGAFQSSYERGASACSACGGPINREITALLDSFIDELAPLADTYSINQMAMSLSSACDQYVKACKKGGVNGVSRGEAGLAIQIRSFQRITDAEGRKT